MKHLILTLLSTICFVISTQAQIEVDGIYYETCSDGVKVVSGDYSGDITIPLEIKYYDGLDDKTYTYKVAAIEDNAFSRNTDITSIKIDALIKKLDVNDCKSLKTLELPNTVEELICDHCPSLTSIPFPANMKELPSLDGCGSITSLTIPTTITSLGNGFYGMDNLESVTIEDSEKDLEYLNVGESCLRSESLKTLYLGRRLSKPISSNALETLELGKFITSLSGVFENCPALVSFKANGEITKISNRTFYNCSALTTVNLPKSIKVIGESAFENCSSLASIDFLENVDSIGREAFSGCSSLDGIVLASGLTSIGENTFWGCTSLRSISIPNTVTSLGKGAFWNCKGLTSIKLSDNIKVIPASAFANCAQLQNIELPDRIERIEKHAFECNKALTSVVLPGTLKYIGPAAFLDDSKLKTVHFEGQLYDWVKITFDDFDGTKEDGGSYYPEDTNPLSYAKEFYLRNNMPLQDISITEEMDSISPRAFAYYRGTINSIVITTGVEHLRIGEDAFYGVKQVPSITIASSLKSIRGKLPSALNVYYSGSMRDYCNLKLYSKSLGSKLTINGQAITTLLELPEGIKVIPSFHFGGLGFTAVSIPNSVTAIEDYAFSSCYNLEEVELPQQTNSIGKAAFEDCSKLKNITKKSTRAQSGESISIGDDAFYWCRELEYINIGSISRVGSGAFEGTKWLDCQPNGILVLGSTLYKYKGDDMPENTTLKVVEGITYIADDAFYEQRNIVGLSLPSSLEYIGNSAFSGNSISKLSLPSSLKYIGKYAFSSNSITKVNIPASVEEIGDKAFSYNALSELVLEDSALPLKVPENGYLLFGNSRSELKNLYLGRTLETSLCVAFKDAPLEKITIGKDVTSIPCLFNDCYRLTQITCLGTEPPILKESYRYDDYTYPTFDDEVFERCTLYVPEGSVDAYKKANVWKNFQNIVGTTTSILQVQDGDCIITKHYDLMGRVISPTAKGIHIVHIFDGKETKVVKTIIK